MNVLVTGATGQLGSEIRGVSKRKRVHNFFFETSIDLDITNVLLVEKYIVKNKIELVINCAAYTFVDKAEKEYVKSFDVNALGVHNLVLALEKVNGKIIHISTDYVFNGESFIPYNESQEVRPVGVYGETKRVGEEYVLSSSIEGVVIRTSWLYSSFGSNFVKTMLHLGKERDKLGVVFDQIGSPTYARDLAELCVSLLDIEKIDLNSKLYHYSNEGVASWYDFAIAIMEMADIKCNVYPIETKEYPTPAKRPNYSLMNKAKIKKDFNIDIPYWRNSLKECIKELQKEKK
ncbi:dTDP-4-dehydrorhamnose reductase [Tenacibaculum ovolyticum]|uniref:dTDP-4-dehydrorhamnose reductase n=1 Tax=Tenacibaculum ovolyticum TaxID=104270 RepID=UPI001EEE22EB|nr:dTDP-4-dehydrorhamnose reductase [Tenacibaculum ovolyticum]